jgi:hypothetical protein
MERNTYSNYNYTTIERSMFAKSIVAQNETNEDKARKKSRYGDERTQSGCKRGVVAQDVDFV